MADAQGPAAAHEQLPPEWEDEEMQFEEQDEEEEGWELNLTLALPVYKGAEAYRRPANSLAGKYLLRGPDSAIPAAEVLPGATGISAGKLAARPLAGTDFETRQAAFHEALPLLKLVTDAEEAASKVGVLGWQCRRNYKKVWWLFETDFTGEDRARLLELNLSPLGTHLVETLVPGGEVLVLAQSFRWCATPRPPRWREDLDNCVHMMAFSTDQLSTDWCGPGDRVLVVGDGGGALNPCPFVRPRPGDQADGLGVPFPSAMRTEPWDGEDFEEPVPLVERSAAPLALWSLMLKVQNLPGMHPYINLSSGSVPRFHVAQVLDNADDMRKTYLAIDLTGGMLIADPSSGGVYVNAYLNEHSISICQGPDNPQQVATASVMSRFFAPVRRHLTGAARDILGAVQGAVDRAVAEGRDPEPAAQEVGPHAYGVLEEHLTALLGDIRAARAKQEAGGYQAAIEYPAGLMRIFSVLPPATEVPAYHNASGVGGGGPAAAGGDEGMPRAGGDSQGTG